MAFGKYEQSRRLSVQGGTRLMDSKRTPIALSLAQGLSQNDRLGPSILSTHAMEVKNKNKMFKKKDLPNATGIACRPRDVDRAPHNAHTHKQTRRRRRTKRGKRRGKGKSGRGGLRPMRKKADRLSRKNFRICSWNCAGASKRRAVLERL